MDMTSGKKKVRLLQKAKPEASTASAEDLSVADSGVDREGIGARLTNAAGALPMTKDAAQVKTQYKFTGIDHFDLFGSPPTRVRRAAVTRLVATAAGMRPPRLEQAPPCVRPSWNERPLAPLPLPLYSVPRQPPP